MPSICLDDVELYYTVDGTGPWLILLNGLFQRIERWSPLLDELRDFRVLRYDMRGQGRSSVPVGPYTPERHARDLAGLLDAVGVERYTLLGLSNGGVVAQQFALAQPPGLTGLVLVSTLARLPVAERAKLESWRAALLRGGVRHRLEVSLPYGIGRSFLTAFPALASADGLREAERDAPTLDAHFHLLDGLLGMRDLRQDLERVEVPTLVVAGAEDILFPPALSRELTAHLGRSELCILPGVGHQPPLENPAQFAPLLRRFR